MKILPFYFWCPYPIIYICFMGLQVHIADGIVFVRDFKNFAAADGLLAINQNEDASGITKPSVKGSCTVSYAEGRERYGVDILIIDVDSSDSR